MRFLAVIWGNVRRKKLRAALTILSILVAFVLFGLLCIVKTAFTEGVTIAGQERLIVRHKVSFIMPLPEAYKARIERIEGVEKAAHWNWFGGIYIDRKNFFGSFPVVPEDFYDVHPEFSVSPEVRKAWAEKRNGAVVGAALLERFGWKVGQVVPLTSPIAAKGGGGAWEFEIVGTYTPTDKAADSISFFFRYDYFDESREQGKGEAGWYSVRVADPRQADQVAAKIDAEFANSPSETKAEPEGAFVQGFAQQVGNIGLIFTSVLAAVFFTILLVVGNTMMQSVRERTEEIGVLKAMGFTNELILVLILAESCLLALMGGLAGLGLAWVSTLGGSPVPSMMPIWFIPERYLAIGAGLALALGIVAGAMPAIQAMRLQTAVALRRHQ